MQHFSTLHAAARAYAEAGIPVFPCSVSGKKPITENGFYDATTDLAKIDAWWSENDFNLAICPEDAGLFVVDVDPGADPAIHAQFPETYRVRTPRGGWHFYFEGSGKTTSNKLAEHIDTRGVGGYVLVPPSVTKNGAYTLDTDAPYARVPGWIYPLIASAEVPLKAATEKLDLGVNIDRARKVLHEYVKRGDVAKEGLGGDDRTYRLCCEMLDFGLSPHVAQELVMQEWNEACEPPWTAEELEQKFYNASQFMQNEAGAYAVEPAADVFGDVVKKLDLPKEKPSRFYFKDEEEMDDEPDPKWLVKELISERSTVMLFGASGSYKSFLALDICLSIATGSHTFGSETNAAPVFYAALEGRAHLRKARRAWRALKNIQGKIDNFYVGFAPMIGVDGEVQEFGDEIAKRCAGRKPALIVIDTLSKSMAGMNENDAADAGKFIRFCDSLVEHFGCSVMAIHHNGKEENRGARGSSAFQAGFDTVLEVKAHKNVKAVSVYVRKHKDAEERDTPWTFEGRVTGPSLTFEQTTPEQHRLLVGDSKEITHKTVGAALKLLKAVGEDAAISTTVLATQLIPARENETVEQRGEVIARTSRTLTAEAKDRLEAYCVKKGRDLYWHLPAPTLDN